MPPCKVATREELSGRDGVRVSKSDKLRDGPVPVTARGTQSAKPRPRSQMTAEPMTTTVRGNGQTCEPLSDGSESRRPPQVYLFYFE